MTAEQKLISQVADMILGVADEAEELDRSDLQGRADVVARDIIKRVKEDM